MGAYVNYIPSTRLLLAKGKHSFIQHEFTVLQFYVRCSQF